MTKTKALTKKEAQKKLDWMVEFYAIRFLFKFAFGTVIALYPMGYLAVENYPYWMVCLGIILSGFLWYLCWKWSIRFKKNCPYCGTPLDVKRLEFGIRKTVVSCPNCKLESTRYQNYEPGTPC